MYTLLETVNYIIAQTGYAPVTDLLTGLPDAASAQLRILEASRFVQKRGWWFNTQLDVTIAKDVNDKFPLPANAIKVLRASPCFITIRNGFAYDMYNQSDVFTEIDELLVSIVVELPYEDLPLVAQDVVRFSAAREHVLIELEDERKSDRIDATARSAWMDLKKDDLEIKRRNLGYNPAVIRLMGGVRPYRYSGSVNPNIPGG
jgi:hypothetical protein